MTVILLWAALLAGCSPKVVGRTEVHYVDSLRIRDSVRVITERNTVTTNLYEYVKDSMSVDVQDSVRTMRLNDSTLLILIQRTKTVERFRERDASSASDRERERADSTAVSEREELSASSAVTEVREVRKPLTGWQRFQIGGF